MWTAPKQRLVCATLDEDGVTLRGLLCANGGSTGFCVR
jgi:hypothetical protein